MPIRIGEAIRKSREAKGLTQEKLAELVDRTAGFIGQVERGLTYPSIPVLAQLVDILGIDANTLFYDDKKSYAYKEITIRVSRLSEEKQEFILSIVNLLERSFHEGTKDENSHMR